MPSSSLHPIPQPLNTHTDSPLQPSPPVTPYTRHPFRSNTPSSDWMTLPPSHDNLPRMLRRELDVFRIVHNMSTRFSSKFADTVNAYMLIPSECAIAILVQIVEMTQFPHDSENHRDKCVSVIKIHVDILLDVEISCLDSCNKMVRRLCDLLHSDVSDYRMLGVLVEAVEEELMMMGWCGDWDHFRLDEYVVNEFDSIESNDLSLGNWIPHQGGKNVIALKWLWKNKCDADIICGSEQNSSCGLSVISKKKALILSQSQYAIKLLKKHGLDEYVFMSTPMATERLDADLQSTPTDQTNYRRMIGGLMYLTASRPDIAFATFVCARYQARPTVKHLKEVKRIFRYLRQSYNMGLWYPKDSGFELIAYSDADHAVYGCVQHSKTKHIDIRYHFIKEHVERGTVEIYFVGTEYQLADLFTKALPKERFEYLVHRIVIIMGQQQQAPDVHPDELCPPNKRYDLMDANKKVDLENVQCPSESKILLNIIMNYPLRFSIAASASVPWIYMAQLWHTLKEDRSKNRLKFLLDRKELTLTLDDFRTIFHLPQANDNNHASFVPPPSFSDMVPFYKQVLGFTMELKTVSNFKILGLLQPWQTLCKIFSKCLTTRVTGWDQLPLQIMQMLYCFVNNIHVDYAELMWEGIYYSLHHPATSIPYPRFTKIIISHYMTIFPDISRRARDAYHNLQDDDIMKNIFNSGRNKNKVGMRIPPWMITEEMKLTEHYKMYAEVFGLDVPLIQSQPTESTQGTHRTLSAPRSPNPATETAESSVPKRSTVIRFRLPSRQSARLTPPVPVPTTEKADEMILQDMLQISLAEQKSREEQEARENVALVYEHLAAEEIEKLVEGSENVDDSSPIKHDDTFIPGTRRRAKGKNVEESRISPIPSPTRSSRNLSTLVSSDTEKLQELTVTHPTPSSGSFAPKLTKTNRLLSLIKAKPNRFKRYKTFFHELQGRYGYLFAHLKKRFMPRTSSDQLTDNLHDVMMETLPSLVKEKVTEQVKKEVPVQVRDQVPVYLAEGLILERKTTKEEMERLISKAILQERRRMQAHISSQIQNLIDNAIPSLVDASANPLLQQQDIAIWLALQMKFEKTRVPHTACRPSVVRTRDQDDPYDDAHPKGENSAKS
ncbi:hypothetical protein Tco_0428574 [Tanacetum coccineum]